MLPLLVIADLVQGLVGLVDVPVGVDVPPRRDVAEPERSRPAGGSRSAKVERYDRGHGVLVCLQELRCPRSVVQDEGERDSERHGEDGPDAISEVRFLKQQPLFPSSFFRPTEVWPEASGLLLLLVRPRRGLLAAFGVLLAPGSAVVIRLATRFGVVTLSLVGPSSGRNTLPKVERHNDDNECPRRGGQLFLVFDGGDELHDDQESYEPGGDERPDYALAVRMSRLPPQPSASPCKTVTLPLAPRGRPR